VKDSKKVNPAAGAKVVDGTGKYLIPGLWDMHVHIWDYESTCPLYIANGVTGVRDMFGPPDADKFRTELAHKTVVAPHFYLASPIVDGHPPIWSGSIEVTTPEQARNVVDDQKKKGADFIKVYSRLAPDAYLAIVAESARVGIPVEGHVPVQVSAWQASDAKQTSFLQTIDIGEKGRQLKRALTIHANRVALSPNFRPKCRAGISLLHRRRCRNCSKSFSEDGLIA
jgi:hypothetical protein